MTLSENRTISMGEVVALMAALMMINAMAIDIMLPALPQLGDSLGVDNENHRQYVVSAYIVGFAISQLFYGPLADRFGRRNPMIAGLAVYVIAAAAGAFAPSFEMLLFWRVVQGIGAASTRVITMSIVRDLYGGRKMAEVMSMVMMVFLLGPIVAPGIGQVINAYYGWRMIFLFMAVFCIVVLAWLILRLPETLKKEDVRSFSPRVVLQGFVIVLTNRTALFYSLASAFMSLASYLNARFVGRFGMRRLSHGSLIGYIVITAVWLVIQMVGPQPMPLAIFIGFFASAMFLFGGIGANFNSLAMEPLGHGAGTASSVLGFMGTLGGGAIGALIGQLYNGTATPLIVGFVSVSSIALVFVLIAERGKLFQPHNLPVR